MKPIVQTSFAQANQGQHPGGSLYLVATPIGNLEDMTYRAIRTLRECDIIAAEDTRQTRKLLTHFDIPAKQLFSYHEHNKAASGPEIIRYIIEGKNVALVSDAGLPAISDPGSDLVRLAIADGIPVIPIPGANAALSALIASGLPTERFTFIGFLPRERKDVMEQLQGLGAASGTLIFYESPHRVKRTLELLKEALGDRSIALARELTKRYEEFVRGTVSECQQWLEEHPPLGEYCIVVQGASIEDELREQNAWWQELSLEEHVARYEQEGMSRKDAMKRTAGDRGVSKRDVYNALL
ncbi:MULTISPECIES: 16S rRNA (cytidine(1402)-2'-O)-methyltransferase [Paenibacillus]|uniref:Ribosomal RNA small subunit methyltransferase I n=1 Tax=Paenibacillus campinasensis TaxID=66347 RepID=A0A268EGL2_9BACL|nr:MULTISPECIES: 16S rRNA (cytidine(1402)-2'-O)-methyltransferase [Paenibacillus]MUG68776.1 16S rRNA (cytidine(1402)-2'-O)-methyltransferase [Paenibacillus campinasensis]PAD72275.1 16S rRNA (cytidine(1402)-2'-O)-methyltransferase [Paenibacillus campinasensis]PAK48741.1 16S rRNA (cytidine(1402)-2'-O)-methyltransferase [Paenibacillus sp. 7541]